MTSSTTGSHAELEEACTNHYTYDGVTLQRVGIVVNKMKQDEIRWKILERGFADFYTSPGYSILFKKLKKLFSTSLLHYFTI